MSAFRMAGVKPALEKYYTSLKVRRMVKGCISTIRYHARGPNFGTGRLCKMLWLNCLKTIATNISNAGNYI